MRSIVLVTALAMTLTPAIVDRAAAADLQLTQATGQPGQGFGPGAGQGRGPGTTAPRDPMLIFDSDHDGSLSYEEFVDSERPGAGANTERARQMRALRFRELDADGDGLLSRSEVDGLR